MRLIDPYPSTQYRGGALTNRTAPPRSLKQQAPIGGINARDALEDMDAQDAITLDNYFPDFGAVKLRPGSTTFADTGAAGDVETLATLVAPGINKFLAAADDKIFDITTGSPVSLGTGFSNARWQWRNMVGLLGLVNGADAPQVYDGTTLGAMTISGVGLTPSDLDGIEVFKSRSYFWDSRAQSFWYSNVDTLGGTLTEFPLGNLGGIGGNLTFMVTWTRDGGDGPDDYAVFMMSTGDVIIYAGNDPGDPANWALVGVYKTGAPVDIRSSAKVAGDVFAITADGYVELSRVINFGRAIPALNFSTKIKNDALNVVRNNSGTFGWRVFHYPAGSRLMFNHPDGGRLYQHVINLETGAWCRFTGWEASSWAIFNDIAYFGGGSGIVFRSHVGTSDDGKSIAGDARQAFTDMGQPGMRKMLSLVKMLFTSGGSLPIRVTVDVDYLLTAKVGELVTIGTGGGSTPWGSPWGSPWATGNSVRECTLSRGTLGDAFSVRLQTLTDNREISWNETTHLYRMAGII